MPNVIAFTPRPRKPETSPAPVLAGIALREHLEGAAQTALDAADKIIAALDRLDGSEAPQEIEIAVGLPPAFCGGGEYPRALPIKPCRSRAGPLSARPA